jgi:hypothetical protein
VAVPANELYQCANVRAVDVPARTNLGTQIAICDLYIGMKKRVEYWGSASLRSGQRLKPNEAIRWYAILETARYGKVILGPADSLQGK